MARSRIYPGPDGDPRQNLKGAQRAVLEGSIAGVEEICLVIVRQAKQNVSDIEAVDRGFLRSSIDHEVRVSRNDVQGTVFVGAEHGVWVEFGRRGLKFNPTTNKDAAKAAWPPVKVIEEWVRRNAKKLAPSGRTKSGRARKPRDQDVRSLAFLISRKIADYGIIPRPYFEPAVRQHQNQVTLFIQRAINRRLAARVSARRRR